MIRRYKPIAPSKGTTIPAELRRLVRARDGWDCVGRMVGMPGTCEGQSEIDHVRASHGVGMKSPTELDNLVLLCSTHHRVKTLEGRKWRPKLLAYLEERAGDAHLSETA